MPQSRFRRCGEEKNLSPVPGIQSRPSSPQPVARRYTNWAIPVISFLFQLRLRSEKAIVSNMEMNNKPMIGWSWRRCINPLHLLPLYGVPWNHERNVFISLFRVLARRTRLTRKLRHWSGPNSVGWYDRRTGKHVEGSFRGLVEVLPCHFSGGPKENDEKPLSW
jgi:hypothetical protein